MLGNMYIPELKSKSLLTVAGKQMALASLGTTRRDWEDAMALWLNGTDHFPDGAPWEDSIRKSQGALGAGPDLAATAQRVFTKIVLGILEAALSATSFPPEAIVLVGGCALNVIVNDLVAKQFGLRVHAPAALNDSGLSLGAAFHAQAAVSMNQTYAECLTVFPSS